MKSRKLNELSHYTLTREQHSHSHMHTLSLFHECTSHMHAHHSHMHCKDKSHSHALHITLTQEPCAMLSIKPWLAFTLPPKFNPSFHSSSTLLLLLHIKPFHISPSILLLLRTTKVTFVHLRNGECENYSRSDQ